jgi:hypothetical protein
MPAMTEQPPPLVRPSEVALVQKVTGEDSPNRTGSRFGFLSTDLGILWDDGAGGVFAAFGDTYGEGWVGPGAGQRTADHRRNVLARSSATDLSSGLPLDSVTEDRPGHAAEILPKDPHRRLESTVIPTAGITVDGVHYLHYMSVKLWGVPGGWRTNYGGIAYSRDDGMTWHKDPDAHWRNTVFGRNRFQLGAFARDTRGDTGDNTDWVYLFGTRNGRAGPVYLARVEPGHLAQPHHYRYWTGRGWHSWWRRAHPVAPGPAGELSVAFHSGLGLWLMVHLEDKAGRIVLRAARAATGPWSEGQTLLSGREYPALYGGYLHPAALRGNEIFFTVSQWGPYNVYLFRARLTSEDKH